MCLEACLGRRRCSIVLSASSPATCTNMRKNTYVVLASIADSAAAAAFLLLMLLLLLLLASAAGASAAVAAAALFVGPEKVGKRQP